METAIDVSRPGETTARFRQICRVYGGEPLYLKCDLNDESGHDPVELFRDLSADITIRDSEGNEITNAKISGKTVQCWRGKIMLAKLAPFPIGDYVATVRVDSGVPALAGKEQTIYAKYLLGDLEQMCAWIAGAFALGAGIVGAASAACVLPGLLRSGIWRKVPTENA